MQNKIRLILISVCIFIFVFITKPFSPLPDTINYLLEEKVYYSVEEKNIQLRNLKGNINDNTVWGTSLSNDPQMIISFDEKIDKLYLITFKVEGNISENDIFQIFYQDKNSAGFSEIKSVKKRLSYSNTVFFPLYQVPENIIRLRLDPLSRKDVTFKITNIKIRGGGE
jgi:hypothetical protein